MVVVNLRKFEFGQVYCYLIFGALINVTKVVTILARLYGVPGTQFVWLPKRETINHSRRLCNYNGYCLVHSRIVQVNTYIEHHQRPMVGVALIVVSLDSNTSLPPILLALNNAVSPQQAASDIRRRQIIPPKGGPTTLSASKCPSQLHDPHEGIPR